MDDKYFIIVGIDSFNHMLFYNYEEELDRDTFLEEPGG